MIEFKDAVEHIIAELCKHDDIDIDMLANKLRSIRAPNKFLIGDRVKVNASSGFSKGATGTVKYVDPTNKVWVLRDHANSDVYFWPEELDKI